MANDKVKIKPSKKVKKKDMIQERIKKNQSCDNYDLSGAHLKELKAKHGYFSESSFERANLAYADMSEADLSYCDFRKANMYDANLQDSNLNGADLRDAYLVRTRVDGSSLKDVLWPEHYGTTKEILRFQGYGHKNYRYDIIMFDNVMRGNCVILPYEKWFGLNEQDEVKMLIHYDWTEGMLETWQDHREEWKQAAIDTGRYSG